MRTKYTIENLENIEFTCYPCDIELKDILPFMNLAYKQGRQISKFVPSCEVSENEIITLLSKCYKQAFKDSRG